MLRNFNFMKDTVITELSQFPLPNDKVRICAECAPHTKQKKGKEVAFYCSFGVFIDRPFRGNADYRNYANSRKALFEALQTCDELSYDIGSYIDDAVINFLQFRADKFIAPASAYTIEISKNALTTVLKLASLDKGLGFRPNAMYSNTVAIWLMPDKSWKACFVGWDDSSAFITGTVSLQPQDIHSHQQILFLNVGMLQLLNDIYAVKEAYLTIEVIEGFKDCQIFYANPETKELPDGVLGGSISHDDSYARRVLKESPESLYQRGGLSFIWDCYSILSKMVLKYKASKRKLSDDVILVFTLKEDLLQVFIHKIGTEERMCIYTTFIEPENIIPNVEYFTCVCLSWLYHIVHTYKQGDIEFWLYLNKTHQPDGSILNESPIIGVRMQEYFFHIAGVYLGTDSKEFLENVNKL